MVAQGDCSSLIIVYAVMADKDLDGIMPLMPVNATYIFTAPQTRRALEGKELLRRYLAFCDSAGRPKNRVYEADSARQALTMAISLAKQTARKPSAASQKLAIPLIYVGGSTYLVSEAVQILKSLQGF
jgi:folylpolyglutamate synthase/dihydropteroate synthase